MSAHIHKWNNERLAIQIRSILKDLNNDCQVVLEEAVRRLTEPTPIRSEGAVGDEDNPQYWFGHLRGRNRNPFGEMLDQENEGYIELGIEATERLLSLIGQQRTELSRIKAENEGLMGERDDWRKQATMNSATLEVIRIGHEEHPYRELSPNFIAEVVARTDETRAKLDRPEEKE